MGFLTRRTQNLDLATRQENERVSRSALARAATLGSKIAEVVDNREATIRSTAVIDANFAMPAANWDANAPNEYLTCYRLLASLKPEEIRILRARSQNFTGNNLVIMAPGEGTRGSDDVTAGFETKWSDQKRDQVISHWKALIKNVPLRFILNAPNMLGEVGWWYDGRIVNVDMNDYQERMSLMVLSGLLNRFPGRKLRILEIGGGYGALCLGLMNALQPSQYVICDLPESLMFSGVYLTAASEHPVRLAAGPRDTLDAQTSGEICLLPNYLAQALMPGQAFDLVINTLSMSEMSPYQIKTYAAMISDAIGSTGVFFEQNHNNKHLGLIDCRDYLPSFFRTQEAVRADIPMTRGEAFAWSN